MGGRGWAWRGCCDVCVANWFNLSDEACENLNAYLNTNKRVYRNCPLTEADKETNRRQSCVRSKVEHSFLTLKRLWGFAKVSYRGLTKNANRAFVMLAMLKINKWGRPLTGEVRPV